jgi:Ion transport protein
MTIEQKAYNFVNGIGSVWAQQFEISIYVMIFIAVAVGCWQTVEGQQNAFNDIEWFAVVIFTIEYIIRLIGAGADPLFSHVHHHHIICRLHFIISFYSIIDLFAIIPFYLSIVLPNSLVNEYDEYLRMLRIIRLVKLDKYVPSITLVGKLRHGWYRFVPEDTITNNRTILLLVIVSLNPSVSDILSVF